MFSFRLKLSADATEVDLDPYVVEPVQRAIEIAAEDQLNNFRGSQVQIVLNNYGGTFNQTGTYPLAGGEEILVYDRGVLIWAGTIDPQYLETDEESNLLAVRVLQHGSLLNTVYAGLEDWTVDNGQLVSIPGRPYRYKGIADQWKRIIHDDSTFNKNIIEDENQTVYFTPTAKDALTDSLYKSKFVEKVHHYHTAGRTIGSVEYPYPQRYFDPGGESGPDEIWTGAFRPHYRPDFDRPPKEWAEEDGGIVYNPGAYLRSSTPVIDFHRQDIPSLLTDLVNKFNLSARFPISFDQTTDCCIISPLIEAEIEILKRQPFVTFYDILVNQNRVFVLVNFGEPPPASPGNFVPRFSLYIIENESAAVPIFEDEQGLASDCWPEFNAGLRFARNFPRHNGVHAYSIALADNPRRFLVRSVFVTGGNPLIDGPFTWAVFEAAGDYPDSQILNRSASVVSINTGEVELRGSISPGIINPPEQLPADMLDFNGRIYRSQNGGLTVTGALFDRVAIDAENAKLSTLISDIAKLKNCRWWVTPERRLKFMSRQLLPDKHLRLGDHQLVKPLKSFRRTFEDISAPNISNNLVIPDNYQQALKNWYEENVKTKSSPGIIAVLDTDSVPSLPEIGDSLELDSFTPEPVADERQAKYGARLQVEKVVRFDDGLAEITAALPTT